jgi:arsenate reductase-like glutaredoxin family protein
MQIIVHRCNTIKNLISTPAEYGVEIDIRTFKINDLEKNKLNHVQEACDKMNNHIDFIEETYTTLQTPLNYVKNKVEYLMGYKNENKSLPTIKDKE